MKKLLLFIFILILNLNVFAAEFNMNSYTSATQNGTKNRYAGTEIMYTGGGNQTWTFGTRYDGRLNNIITYYDYPFEGNTTYRFTYNMATNDFNNNFSSSWWWDCSEQSPTPHVFIPTYVSYKKVQFSITPSENTTCIKVELAAKSNGNGITQIKNWNLSSITLYDPDYQSGSSGGQGTTPSPTPTPSGNQDIIDNQNNNTQDIINNQNENTSNIISSIQETTQQVSETMENIFTNKCSNIFDYNDYYHIENNAVIESIDDDKIIISAQNEWAFVGYDLLTTSGTKYYISGSMLSSNLFSSGMLWVCSDEICANKLYTIEANDDFSSYFIAPDEHVYLRIYATKGLTPTSVIYYHVMVSDSSSTYCTFGSDLSNKIDDTNDLLNNLNDTINNDSIDDKTGFFTNFQDNTHGLTGIITAPLTTIQGLANTSCVALSIPIPYTNSNVSLPCMTQVYQTYVPTVFSLWQVVSFGIISYFICIDIFKMVKGFKDPNEDKVEVLDL